MNSFFSHKTTSGIMILLSLALGACKKESSKKSHSNNPYWTNGSDPYEKPEEDETPVSKPEIEYKPRQYQYTFDEKTGLCTEVTDGFVGYKYFHLTECGHVSSSLENNYNGTNLSNLEWKNFTNANLRGILFNSYGTDISLVGSDFSGADLTGARLNIPSLKHLQYTKWQNAILYDAEISLNVSTKDILAQSYFFNGAKMNHRTVIYLEEPEGEAPGNQLSLVNLRDKFGIQFEFAYTTKPIEFLPQIETVGVDSIYTRFLAADLNRIKELEFSTREDQSNLDDFTNQTEVSGRNFLEYLNTRIKYLGFDITPKDSGAYNVTTGIFLDSIYEIKKSWVNILSTFSPKVVRIRESPNLLFNKQKISIKHFSEGLVKLNSPFFRTSSPVYRLKAMLHEARHSECLLPQDTVKNIKTTISFFNTYQARVLNRDRNYKENSNLSDKDLVSGIEGFLKSDKFERQVGTYPDCGFHHISCSAQHPDATLRTSDPEDQGCDDIKIGAHGMSLSTLKEIAKNCTNCRANDKAIAEIMAIHDANRLVDSNLIYGFKARERDSNSLSISADKAIQFNGPR
jgi:hypothetical protein